MGAEWLRAILHLSDKDDNTGIVSGLVGNSYRHLAVGTAPGMAAADTRVPAWETTLPGRQQVAAPTWSPQLLALASLGPDCEVW